MRFAMIAAAFGAACLSVPAQAQIATIVQWDSMLVEQGVAYFDTSLGTLLSVRFDYTPDFMRGFQIIVPGQVDSAVVSWDVSNGQFCHAGCNNLVASGGSVLPLTYSPDLFGGSSYAYLSVWFSGPTSTAYLDPAQFINPPYPGARMALASPDVGLYDDTFLDIFQISGGGYARNGNAAVGCVNSVSGCDASIFRLTYSYAVGGVPEPTTWAMMIIGFGAMGAAMRRRRVRIGYA